MNFSNQVVMVTGAAGNLASAVVLRFAQCGAKLVLIDRAAFTAPALPEDAQCLQLKADLLKQGEVDEAVRAALQHFGRVDVPCNLAGGFRMGEAVHETSPATFDFLFDLNARTIVHTTRAVTPSMLEQGRGKVVNVGAFSGQRGIAQMGAYTASKAAVARLTEAMSAEVRERGINVNCVLPNIIDTPENRAAMPDADSRRWVAPADLAEVIVFLASDGAKAVHGASLPVSGLS